MSTRSDIIAKGADGQWRRIYCHHDGYLSQVGLKLFNHYTGQAKIDELMALGDISSLGEDIGEKHDFDRYRELLAKGEKMCNAYGRDRGEKDTQARVGETLSAVWPEADTWTEFTYVWDGEKWLAGDPDEGTQTLKDLGDLLLCKENLRPLVKVPFIGAIGRHKGGSDV